MKIRNYYYLIAGVLAMLFAFTHAWNGQSTVLPILDLNDVAMDTNIIFRYVWHIITAENLVFGIVFIILSYQRERSKNRPVALMIVSVLLVRLTVILGVTAFYDASALTDTLIDSVAILVYIVLICLGIRMKNNDFGGQSA